MQGIRRENLVGECFLISTQKRILAPLSLLINYIMTQNVKTLLLIRKRILILNLML